jgi:cellulose synthase/poly-beta-1,6-N-acetylglucosamine synthase-like glycosyltransferase
VDLNGFIVILTTLTFIYVVISLLFFLGLFVKRPGKNQLKYTVSVIIAARNEEKNVSQLLVDLMHQTYPKNAYEVIVVNDGSSDRTAHIVTEIAQQYNNVHLLTLKNIPPLYSPKKFAVSTAVDYSKGEIILTADADCRVKSTWIEAMVSYFDPNVGMVIGFSQFGRKRDKQNLLEQLQAIDFLQLMAASAGSCTLGYPLAASGQNLGYRKETFRQVGGYTRVAQRISGDDVLLLQLVRRLTKWRIVFAHSAHTFNTSQPQKTLIALLNQRTRWASNASYQIRLNKLFWGYLVVVFTVNALFFFGVPISVLIHTSSAKLWTCLLIKIGAELLVAVGAARKFNRFDLLKYFPIWALLQVPYVVIAGMLGVFGKFNWKERDYQAEVHPETG